MSFMSSVNKNKANIIEAATHVAVGAYLVHQSYKNPNQETINTFIACLTGAVVGATHGFISEPGGTLCLEETDEKNVEEGARMKGFFEEDSRFSKAGLGLLRGATIGVLSYKVARLTAEHYQQTSEVIGDVAGDAVDMIA